MIRRVVACFLVFAAGAVAGAQDPEAPPPIKLTLHPAAVPSPALKYRLLPELGNQTPGNAATLYGKAAEALKRLPGDAREKQQRDWQLTKWEEMPLKDLPHGEVRQTLAKYEKVYRLIEKATRCRHCDWGYVERIRKEGPLAGLDEFVSLRQFALLLAVRARLEMAEGKLDEALRTLQTGFALARHTGEAPPLITSLVGIAIAQVMMRQVDEFIQQPGAPNLYWALTDLPKPFLDMHKVLEGERLFAYEYFPGLYEAATDLRAGPLTPKQAQGCVKAVLDLYGFKTREDLDRALKGKQEQAKRALIKQGRPRERVEAMPQVQVALLHTFLHYDRLLDDIAKWQNFPYWQARPQIQKIHKRQEALEISKETPAIWARHTLLPMLDGILLARTRIDRRIAALRCLEGIRLYAAHHDGKLPTSLDTINEVPVPRDPVTGKDFAYHVEGDRARLYGPPPEGEKADLRNSVWYELTLKR